MLLFQHEKQQMKTYRIVKYPQTCSAHSDRTTNKTPARRHIYTQQHAVFKNKEYRMLRTMIQMQKLVEWGD